MKQLFILVYALMIVFAAYAQQSPEKRHLPGVPYRPSRVILPPTLPLKEVPAPVTNTETHVFSLDIQNQMLRLEKDELEQGERMRHAKDEFDQAKKAVMDDVTKLNAIGTEALKSVNLDPAKWTIDYNRMIAVPKTK